MKTLTYLTVSRFLSRLLAGFILLSVLLSTASVFAQGSEQLILRRKASKVKVEQKLWSLPLNLERSSTLHEQGSYERESFTSLELAPSYKINSNWSLGARTMIYKEENAVGNSGFDNTSIGLVRSFMPSKKIHYSVTAGVILPTDAKLREETSYQGGARVIGTVRALELFRGSTLSYSLQLSRSVHEYEQTAEGIFNVKQNVTNSIVYSQPFTETISLTTSFAYVYGWTYLDDSRTKFAVGADLGWQATPAFGVYLGTSNEGNALKPNGSDSNIEFYNDNSSIVKVGLNYVI